MACIEFVYGEKQGPRERERPQGVRDKCWFAIGGFCGGGKPTPEACLKHAKVQERRWVLLKIPRCDIDGVGEGK